MIKIYGLSDDLVETCGSAYKGNEIDCWNSDVRIQLVDGTVIRVGYTKEIVAIWWIEIKKRGPAEQSRD